MLNEFVLTIDGCPPAFATAGLSAVTSADADWNADGGYATCTLVTNGLAYRDYSFTEKVRPIDGDLSVSGLSFTLNDVDVLVDGFTYSSGVTHLGTRSVANLVSTELDQATSGIVDGDGLADIEVASVTGFDGAGGYIWVDQECIRYDGITGNAFNISAPARGYFGSRGVSHRTDAANSYAPAVFASFPDFARRRVVLWMADGNSVLTRVWAGYVIRTLKAQTGTASYELDCEHVWTVSRSFPLAIPSALCSTRGFMPSVVVAKIEYAGAPNLLATPVRPDPADLYRDTLAETLLKVQQHVRDNLNTYSPGAAISPTLSESRGGAAFSVTASVGTAITVTLGFGRGTLATAQSVESGDPRHATASLPAPTALIRYGRATSTAGAETYLIDNIDGLPTSWSATNISSDVGFPTTIQPVLRGKLGDNAFLVIEPTSVSSAGVVTGTARIEADDGSAAFVNSVVTEPTELQLCIRVDTQHWGYGLRRGLIEDTSFVSSGADSRDWDWSRLYTVIGATAGGPNRRAWYLSGDVTLDKIVSDLLKLNGCALGMRDGKMSPFAFHIPLESDAGDVTITAETDLVVDTAPEWTPLDEGIANVVKLDAGFGTTIIVRDQRSIARFGPGRQIDLALLGQGELRVMAPSSPTDLTQYLLRRVIGLWSTPVSLVSYQLGLDKIFSVYLGDLVSCTDWFSPDGNGARGISGTIGQSLEREVNIPVDGRGFVGISVILFGKSRLGAYASCVRVTNIDGATKDCTIGIAYLGAGGLSACTDYAGSNLASYTGSGGGAVRERVIGDGGTAFIAVGDKLRLVERDNVTPRTPEDVTVTAVTTTHVFVSPAPNVAWQAIIAGGGIVDMIPQTFSALTTHQKNFAAVGARATGVIDSTASTEFVWS